MKKFLIGFVILLIGLMIYAAIQTIPRKACFYDFCITLPYNYVGRYLSESVGAGEVEEVAIYHQTQLLDKPNQDLLITVAKCDFEDLDVESAKEFVFEQVKEEERSNLAGEIPIAGLGAPLVAKLKDPRPNISAENLIELDGNQFARCNDYRLRPNRDDKRVFMFVANQILYELIYYPSLFDKDVSGKILSSITIN